MSDKPKVLQTPVGEVKFPSTEINGTEVFWLTSPDEKKEGEEYKLSFALAFDPKEGADVLDELRTLCDGVKKRNFETIKKDKSKNPDTDAMEETGKVLINFKSYYAPAIVDAKKNKVTSGVGWGSKVRVAFAPRVTDNAKNKKYGITCYCKAIQVIELSESGDASNVFDETDGYVANQATSAPEANGDSVDWEE